MKKLLSNLLAIEPGRFANDIALMLIGLLIVTGSRIGVQTPGSEVRWVEGFSKIDVWVGWVVVWFAFDGFLGGKVTTFVLSKTIVPFVRAVLDNVLGEERLNAWSGRFDKSDTEDKE